ncbi:TPA: D-glycero-beta-D-manno-heptose 1-phosphate adenylyltransferase [Candidatus Galligastranaerophilus intestinigallinarum]|nr:D-glycero-beta-D-manno-heptose 1-phosphate adenylyltransferase [Candidatus Galligastranaerophilus intestinigallinarum]
MEKLIEKENLDNIIKKLKSENKKIVFTNGCFDILHAGHVRYLKESKKFGDILIVGLNSDVSVKKIKGESRPINPEMDRAEVLAGLEAVSYIVLFDETSPVKLLEEIKPDIYTKGADYTVETLPEAKTVLSYGGKIEFIKFLEGRSTTKIIDKIK